MPASDRGELDTRPEEDAKNTTPLELHHGWSTTSQLPTAKWHDHLGDPTTADAICDRILSNAHRLKLAGPSRRKEESNLTE